MLRQSTTVSTCLVPWVTLIFQLQENTFFSTLLEIALVVTCKSGEQMSHFTNGEILGSWQQNYSLDRGLCPFQATEGCTDSPSPKYIGEKILSAFRV